MLGASRLRQLIHDAPRYYLSREFKEKVQCGIKTGQGHVGKELRKDAGSHHGRWCQLIVI